MESEEKTAKTNQEIKKIGSRPPSYEHKCYGCNPCEAIQVPTTSTIVAIRIIFFFFG
ncbi:epidermal patterning factor-like protein 3 [Phtheirospermum japonicum]|uniref:Epidermal patterning factor-like protein 3 n=1 Tax=Phtheirospermum japonicum TaxID=374723 RepID=A0A830BJH5_9LAMI|nr:epidermal patterning factor-like protein 3 [Phtheirospermum japonicum]